MAYAKHYCGGLEMESKITLGEESLSCGAKMGIPPKAVESHEKHSCCSDKYLQVTTDDHFAKASFDFHVENLWVPTLLEVLFTLNESVPKADQLVFSEYYPPPLQQNLQVLYETFLI